MRPLCFAGERRTMGNIGKIAAFAAATAASAVAGAALSRCIDRQDGEKGAAREDALHSAGEGVAVYYDGENVSAKAFDTAIDIASRLGMVRQVRVYAPLGCLAGESWQEVGACAAERVVCHGSAAGKNSVDIRIVIDVLNDLHAGRFSDFVVVSDDSDYTPLVEEIRRAGGRAHGIGVREAGASQVSGVYDTWHHISKSSKKKPRGEAGLATEEVAKLVKAVGFCRCSDGWSRVRSVGKVLEATYKLTPSQMGYPSTAALLQAAGVFKFKGAGDAQKTRFRD